MFFSITSSMSKDSKYLFLDMLSMVQLVSESLGWLRAYTALLMTHWSLSYNSRVLFILSMISWILPNIFYILFILPTTVEASPRSTPLSAILLLVLLSFIAGGSLFTLTVQPLCGCDKNRT